MKNLVLSIVTLQILAAGGYAAPNLTATYTPLQFGGYRFEFVVCTDELNGSCGWGVERTDFADLAAPQGWRVGADTRKTNWDSLLPVYDVHPNSVKRGFAGTLILLPEAMDYFVRLTGPGYGAYYGTLVPTAVPEPSTLVVLALGFAGQLMRRRRSY